MHLLHVKETPSNRRMAMETEMSFFKMDDVTISKITYAASNIAVYTKIKYEISSFMKNQGGSEFYFSALSVVTCHSEHS